MGDLFQEEGSWNLSFAGAGFLGLYHVGVTQCLKERAPRLLQGARRIYGSSSGSLNAVSILAGKSAGASRGPRGRPGGLGDSRGEPVLTRAGGSRERGVWGPRTLPSIPCASLGDSGDGYPLSRKRGPRVRAGKTIPKGPWGLK